jgi:hypothetical protein
LDEALKNRASKIPTVAYPLPCRHSNATGFSETTHSSEHSRTFTYVQTGVAAPKIVVRHLWLKRD